MVTSPPWSARCIGTQGTKNPCAQPLNGSVRSHACAVLLRRPNRPVPEDRDTERDSRGSAREEELRDPRSSDDGFRGSRDSDRDGETPLEPRSPGSSRSSAPKESHAPVTAPGTRNAASSSPAAKKVEAPAAAGTTPTRRCATAERSMAVALKQCRGWGQANCVGDAQLPADCCRGHAA